jgi:hypothetical protein
MKKFIPLIMVAGFSSPAFADITHRMSSSLQLTTNVGGLGTLTDGVGQGSISTATHVANSAFSFSQSFIEGDAISTTAPAVGAVSPYSSQVTNAVGSGTGSGTVLSSGAITAVGGGSGTSTIGQFVTELQIN